MGQRDLLADGGSTVPPLKPLAMNLHLAILGVCKQAIMESYGPIKPLKPVHLGLIAMTLLVLSKFLINYLFIQFKNIMQIYKRQITFTKED